MRALFWVTMVLCAAASAPLLAQSPGAAVDRPLPLTSVLLRRPRLNALEWQEAADSVKRRPFYLPRPGEQVAYWLGFGAGVAVSPLAWCHGQDCGVLRNASRSLLLGGIGAISGMLLKRAF